MVWQQVLEILVESKMKRFFKIKKLSSQTTDKVLSTEANSRACEITGLVSADHLVSAGVVY
jgi:hypothetical protein